MFKIDTEEKKIAYLLGYIQSLAEQHANEFGRNVEDVKKELLESAMKRNEN